MDNRIANLARGHWPFILVLAAYWLSVICLVVYSMQLTEGNLIYALDDSYIHMSMAKNAAVHGVWGVTRYGFSSSTSSPLWTLLLAINYVLFGVNNLSPLLLNLFFASLTVLLSYRYLKQNINSPFTVFLILLAAVFAAPLPALTLVGMEHILHLYLSLGFLILAVKNVINENYRIDKSFRLLFACSALLAMVRYEGLFIIFMICAVLLVRRKRIHAVLLGAAGLMPVLFYGLWSMANGWYFFPNSLLLKAQLPNSSHTGLLEELGRGAIRVLHSEKCCLFLLIAALLLIIVHSIKKPRTNDSAKYALVIYSGSLLLHLQFASTGWFFRYEAYLIYLGIIIISITVKEYLTWQHINSIVNDKFLHKAAFTCLFIFLCYPYIIRSTSSLWGAPKASRNIYDQQYQMGLFLRQYFEYKACALNDIGAATYLADIQLVDLFGLGSLESARLKLNNNFTTSEIHNLTYQKHVQVAVVYDSWFRHETKAGIPQEWIRVGRWRIPENVICGDDTIAFYAVEPSEAESLKRNLKQFRSLLPMDVQHIEENR